jgi:hypothetical protein
MIQEIEFAPDSLLEEAGFELLVPRDTRSDARRFCWSVLAPDRMYPMSDGRTDDSARAQCPSSRRERTFTSALRISLVVQPSSGELPLQSAD